MNWVAWFTNLKNVENQVAFSWWNPSCGQQLEPAPTCSNSPFLLYTLWILDMAIYRPQNNVSQFIFTVGFPYLGIQPTTEQRFRKKYYICISGFHIGTLNLYELFFPFMRKFSINLLQIPRNKYTCICEFTIHI